jgi:predicted choloylglycine hydrolase
MIALTLAQGFEIQLAPAHRDEVQALAKQVGLDEREAMLAQCFLDLSPITACSTITLSADASPDGIARFGRNLDFPGRAIADKHTVVMIYHPKDAHAFVAVGWPGLIGVLSGMNEHGLTLANMEITRPSRLPTAMPYTLLYRTILEKCATVDEAIELLNKTPRQTPNNLMLMDAAGNRAVAEITPQSVTIRRGEPGKPLMSTNHHRGQDGMKPGRCDRYDTILKLATAQYGKIDPKSIESMLARVAQGNMTLQSMVFEPSTRVMYLATGANAASREFYRLDLNPYFHE